MDPKNKRKDLDKSINFYDPKKNKLWGSEEEKKVLKGNESKIE